MKRQTAAAAIIAILVLSSEAHADRKTEEIALIAAMVADSVTTEVGITSGLHEGNPALVGQRGKRIAIKAASAASTVLLGRLLDRRGHGTWASALRLSFTAVYAGTAAWNVGVIVSF